MKKILKTIYSFLPTQYLRKLALSLSGYKIGLKVYLPASLRISDIKTNRYNVVVEDRVSFGPNVLIITDSSPNNSQLVKLFPLVSKKVIIKQDSWVGANVTILPGVTIGSYCVIGSGSIVVRDIPDFSIAVGNPAKVIKSIDIKKIKE